MTTAPNWPRPQPRLKPKKLRLRKIMNGAREQERGEAQASVREAQAVMSNAQAELARRQDLFQSGVISREELDRYTRQYEVAKEQYQEKSNHASLAEQRFAGRRCCLCPG